jgi:hypothetical protein
MQISVDAYRVPPGHVAITIDFTGFTPLTVVVPATDLVQVRDRLDRVFSGITYSHVLALFGREFREITGGKAKSGMEMVPVWLALRHPAGGPAMQCAISESLLHTGSAHVTIHAGTNGGIAMALGGRFIDLEIPLAVSKHMGVDGIVIKHGRRWGGDDAVTAAATDNWRGGFKPPTTKGAACCGSMRGHANRPRHEEEANSTASAGA